MSKPRIIGYIKTYTPNNRQKTFKKKNEKGWKKK